MNEVTIYTSATCPYSPSAKALLDQRGIRYQEIEVGKDTDQAIESDQRSQKLTVPQIFVGDHLVGGMKDLHVAESSGLLDALLTHDISDKPINDDSRDTAYAQSTPTSKPLKPGLSFKTLASNKWLNAVMFALVMISYASSGLKTYAAEGDFLSWQVPTEARVLGGTDKFKDVRMAAFAYRLPATQRFRINRFELASGVISADDQDRLFVSIGPIWNVPLGNRRTFVEFGLSPTILSGSSFGDRELGGNFHFTSSIALGAKFGAQEHFSVSLRGQHTSNGGIRNDNPGLDLFGLNFSYQFER